MEERKRCPLAWAKDPTHTGVYTLCIKSACAWWHEGHCAVFALVDAAERMSCSLEDISHD